MPLFKSTIMIAILVLPSINIEAVGNSYRYKDAAGATHIGYSVPPKLIQNGYEVLNERGRVISVYLPQRQINIHNAEALTQAEQQHNIELQQQKAKELLRNYSIPEDIERIRIRKLHEFDDFIARQEGNVISFRKKIANLQHQAANFERGNQPVPVKILAAIKILENKIDDATLSIIKKQQERKQTDNSFAADIKLLKKLTSHKRKESN